MSSPPANWPMLSLTDNGNVTYGYYCRTHQRWCRRTWRDYALLEDDACDCVGPPDADSMRPIPRSSSLELHARK